jgi:hypothetical protein
MRILSGAWKLIQKKASQKLEADCHEQEDEEAFNKISTIIQ